MKPLSIGIVTLGLIGTLAAAPANAQTTGSPLLHVATAYDNCYFDLHPELTPAQFEEFAREVGSIMRFRQLGDATTLGKGHFDISFDYSSSHIDDSKGAWNNTMSHPAADHYLGDTIAFPRIVARYGMTDRADFGVWGGVNGSSNYGMVGVDTKIALVKQGPNRPVSVAIRPNATALVGPATMWAANAAVDLTVGREMGPFAPYAGVVAGSSVAIARGSAVNLDPATAGDTSAYAGVSYRWRVLQLSAEVEGGVVPSYAFRVGTRF